MSHSGLGGTLKTTQDRSSGCMTGHVLVVAGPVKVGAVVPSVVVQLAEARQGPGSVCRRPVARQGRAVGVVRVGHGRQPDRVAPRVAAHGVAVSAAMARVSTATNHSRRKKKDRLHFRSLI